MRAPSRMVPSAVFWVSGVAVLIGVVGGGISGCRQPPLRGSDARSQFDQYDLSRNEFEPSYRFDEYGKRRPNLRGRLLDDK